MIKISEQWLREWVDPQLDVNALADKLTKAGLEVDSVSPVAAQFSGVIVASVIETTPHPEAQRLTICQVDAGLDKPLQIVCGAKNVRAGLKVALAMIGATLPDITIERAMLRGQLSEGMLCSTEELGMSGQQEGILELPAEAQIGQTLREYLQLDDHVLEIDLTPNRGDCLSVYGIAREVAALTHQPLKPLIQPMIALRGENQGPTVFVAATEACPQYIGRVIRDIQTDAVTPFWMSERLMRAGLRCVHPIVDITNYVMLECGQPMHAFDLDRIQGDIHVRYAHQGETLELLNDQRIDLTAQSLVIADAEKPLALAGVMGGTCAAVEVETQSIFLECAYFTPERMAGVARSFGLCTDASQRYERGVDFAMASYAVARATDLIIQIAGGIAAPEISVQTSAQLPQKKNIPFFPGCFKKLTGLDIEATVMANLLRGLGMVVNQSAEPWQVLPPSYRFDIHQDVDLVEEILRLYGYDQIPCETMHMGAISVEPDSLMQLNQQFLNFFTARGYYETISYSFVDPDLHMLLYPEKAVLRLVNPISSELAVMRGGLWPGLLASMLYNQNRQQQSIKMIETGVVFQEVGDTWQEHACIAGLLAGECGMLNWSMQGRFFDFYDVKGDLDAFFKMHHVKNVTFIAATHSALHPGKSAKICLNDQVIGWCGVLHPRICELLDITHEPILFEVQLNHLVPQVPVRYQGISKYPTVRRDLALLCAETITAAEVEAVIRACDGDRFLRSFDVFDVYMGDNIPEGKKSMAIALIWQDQTATLQDERINQLIDVIIQRLTTSLSITLRN